MPIWNKSSWSPLIVYDWNVGEGHQHTFDPFSFIHLFLGFLGRLLLGNLLPIYLAVPYMILCEMLMSFDWNTKKRGVGKDSVQFLFGCILCNIFGYSLAAYNNVSMRWIYDSGHC